MYVLDINTHPGGFECVIERTSIMHSTLNLYYTGEKRRQVMVLDGDRK